METHKTRKASKILALKLTGAKFGYAVVEKESLLIFGVRTVRDGAAARTADVLTFLSQLEVAFAPAAIVIGTTPAAWKSTRRTLSAWAKERQPHLRFMEWRRAAEAGLRDRQRIAADVTHRCPGLERYLDLDRLTGRDDWTTACEAVALALDGAGSSDASNSN